MALSVFLLFQGCAAPLAGELSKPLPSSARNAPPIAARAEAAGETPDPEVAQAQARVRAAGGLDPAPDLEGRPLPSNPDQMASGDARSLAGGKATGEAKRVAENWLGQFGTARLDLLGSFHGGALDMLFPLHDSGTGLIFSQFGARRTNLLQESYRTTVNIGVGYRHFADGFMLGGNAFLDQDVSRGHRRLGLGGEWWADYLKLGMNGYIRLSDWKRSPDARDYQERPASGWDIRTEGYLPWYPQLGGKLMFEKYYGDEVGLFGASSRQKNPGAWTLGVSYTPAPAVTLGLDHRMGQGGKSDTSFKLGLKYALGVPLAKQMQPGEVAGSRKLAGMRMDLVERNNEIVLEYKKNDPMTIQLPSAAAGYPQTVLSFPVTLAGADAAPRIEWSGSAAPFAVPYSGGASGSLKLPDYRSDGINSYQLMASATDAHGRKIRSNIMNVSVNPLSVSVARSKAAAMADGVDSVRFTAQVRGVQAEAMAGRAVQWALKAAGTIRESSNRTDADGMAYAVVSSKVAAVVGIEATESQGFKGASEAEFLDDQITLGVAQLDAAPASMLANGRDKAVLKATVKDSKGNAAGAGVAVSWTATGGQLAGPGSNTDANGVAVMELLSATVPGAAVVTAKTGPADPGKTRSVEFLLDASDAKVVLLTPGKTIALADGVDTVTLTATVADGRGNPVGAGVAVNWSASLGTLGATASNTDANSQATVVLTAPAAGGTATVTARGASGDAGKTAAIAFVADAASARVVSLVPGEASGVANGTDSVVLTATVEDASGNRVGAGVAVNWTATLGAIATTSVTNASGQATALLTAPFISGTATITATAAKGDAGKTVSVGFEADVQRARVVALAPSKTSGLANGADTITLTAKVDDGRGNPAGAGVAVQWTTDQGTIAASSVTNASSEATVVLTAPTVIGTATVTAKCAPAAKVARGAAGDPGKTAAIAFTADLSSARVVALSPSKTGGVANGLDTVTFTATVADAAGNAVGAGVTVSWNTSLGTLAGPVSKTDASSQATVVLTAPTMIGLATVTAKCAPVRQGKSLGSDPGKTAAIAFTADTSSARVIELSPSKKVGVANGLDTVTFMASVVDAQGNPVGAGVTVNWSASLGTLDATSITDGKSETSIVLTAPTAAGVASILAKAASGDAGKTASVTFTADVSTARVVSLVPMRGTSTTFPAGLEVNLRATVQDAYGNPVGAGVTITWSSDSAILDLATSTTSEGGTATNTVTYYAAGTVLVTAQAVAGDPGKTLVMNYAADPSRDYVSTLNVNKNTGVADGSGTAIFTAVVRNQFNDPVGAGITVHWTTTGGILAAPTSMTDAAGAASIVLTAPTVAGEVSVSAKAGANDENNNFAVVTFKNSASSPRVGSASTSKTRIVANGRDSAIFTAMVLDGNGNSRGEGHVVNWSTDLGTLDGAASKTNASGAATAVLTAGTVAGLASVTARVGAGDPGATVRVTLMADPLSPRVASLTASKTSGRANGTDTVTLTATVRDANGNLEDAGIIVNWRTDRGTLAAATSSTNARGMATVELRAPTSVGTAVLTARTVAADPGKTVRVKFTSRAITP